MRSKRMLWIVALCACACAQSGGDERLSESPVKRATAGTISSSGAAEVTSSYDAGVRRVMAQDAGSPDAAASSVCHDLSVAFQARLAAASGACATSADCACFTSIVESPACGGVTDATSARELNDLAARFLAADCRLPWECGPGHCAPQCAAHRCR